MNTIPEGYKENAKGNLVPISKIKEIDQIRDEEVNRLIKDARQLQQKMMVFKSQVRQTVTDFVDLSADQYDISLGGKKGNISLQSFDGRKKVQLSISENIGFDERLQVAKELIHQCIEEWSKDVNDNIKVLVDQAFEVDKEGNISTARVLGLRRLDMNDKRWDKAMQAISDSITVTNTKEYIRFYQRRELDQKFEPIALDLAAL